jgi:positive regulator of sigma E activity
MLQNLFEQHPYFTVLSIIGLAAMFLFYRYFRTKILLEKPNRNVWDTALFPGVSKLFWQEERSIVIPIGLLIVVAILALITAKNELWDLFKVNLGVVIGICVRWAEYKIQQKKESTNQPQTEKG